MVPADRSTRPLNPVATVVIYAGLTLGMLLLIALKLRPDNEIVGGGLEKTALTNMEAELNHNSELIAKVADGRPLSFNMNGDLKNANGRELFKLAGIYYYCSYRLYPDRIFVGQDRRIVNSASDLVGPKSSDRWLTDHGVQNSIDYTIDPAGSLRPALIPVR